jgi:hypothetical protein
VEDDVEHGRPSSPAPQRGADATGCHEVTDIHTKMPAIGSNAEAHSGELLGRRDQEVTNSHFRRGPAGIPSA